MLTRGHSHIAIEETEMASRWEYGLVELICYLVRVIYRVRVMESESDGNDINYRLPVEQICAKRFTINR